MGRTVRHLVSVTALVTALGLTACGGDESGAGTTLNWFIFNEPSGAPQQAAAQCSQQSNGRYTIEFEYLPSSADQQREQLVRRLGAEDDSLDILGMDVIWTGEFANAGWITEVPAGTQNVVTRNVFESMLDSARFEDKLFAAPIWSNTQLLWYREDRVDQPPETWDEMIDMAERIGPQGTIQVQANRYEGLVVWANSMIESAGTSILSGPQELALDQPETERALAVMGRLSNTPAAAAPDITTSNEDSARLGFEAGDSTFMVNYPFVFPSAQENAPEIFENMGAAKYPRVDPNLESKPPLGGINLGVSSFSDKQDLAWEAVECLVQPENQLNIAREGGLPPVREDLYDRQEIEEIYPGFADVIRESIQDAAPRPSESPAYQDLSLAIQRAIHPTTDINPRNPTPTYEKLRERVEQAVERRGLL